jgi:small subunit ribosomal protein S9
METTTTELANYAATGRRKEAVARATLSTGSGKVEVNGRAFEEYFPSTNLQNTVMRPLEVTKNNSVYDIRLKTTGGGPMGQAGAASLAIARALLQVSPENRPLLKAQGLLTRDPRMKERKKPGQPGARKRFQFSKR